MCKADLSHIDSRDLREVFSMDGPLRDYIIGETHQRTILTILSSDLELAHLHVHLYLASRDLRLSIFVRELSA
jgi:hypothetical protein